MCGAGVQVFLRYNWEVLSITVQIWMMSFGVIANILVFMGLCILMKLWQVMHDRACV